ncbi:MAG: ATP-binding protein [Nanoarchaeota archaeon]
MINKDKWAESIKDFQEKKLPSLYRREIEIPTERPVKRAVSIIGPRRSGKTYEMYLLIRKLVEKYNKKRILYVNFERADLGLVKREDLVKMKEVYYELFPEFKDKEVWFFLDEIQNVDGWEKFVRTCLDEEINVYLSGSSSKMLSQEIATSMRGRNLPYKILPFSFREFLDTKNIDYKNHLSSKQKSNIKNLFNKYLKFGGYPEVIIHRKEREKILKDIYDTALYRDVVDRANIRNTKVMELLINALVKSKEFSVNKFYNFLKSSNIKASKTHYIIILAI